MSEKDTRITDILSRLPTNLDHIQLFSLFPKYEPEGGGENLLIAGQTLRKFDVKPTEVNVKKEVPYFKLMVNYCTSRFAQEGKEWTKMYMYRCI